MFSTKNSQEPPISTAEAQRLKDLAEGIIYGTRQWDAAHYGRLAAERMTRPVPWWQDDLDIDGAFVIGRAQMFAIWAARAAFKYRPDLRRD